MERADAIAARRFGYGAGPGMPSGGPDAMLAALAGPDRGEALFPTPDPGPAHALLVARRQAVLDRREADRLGADASAATAGLRAARAGVGALLDGHLRRTLARALDAPDAFRERLAAFWTDHFATAARHPAERALMGDFVGAAIRPHLAGRFADMPKAATVHPVMLSYPAQAGSMGPGSRVGRARGRGLNENHARELLELHTLGPGGPYGQSDVRQLAELMTGWTVRHDTRGTTFWRGIAEPGAETVLGRGYGGGPASPDHLMAALEDLSVHPDTARSLARKLAVHFVSDAPPEDLVEAMARAHLEGGGDLARVYAALLAHPAAWSAEAPKIRRPLEWMATAMRALGIAGRAAMEAPRPLLRRAVIAPLARMGQPFARPPGPDGWPEGAGRWAEPQSLAERIGWAMRAPRALLPELPDPRELAARAVPWGVPPELALAAAAAESRRDGVGLVLVSPSLLRR